MNLRSLAMIDRLFFAAFMFCLFVGTGLAADAAWLALGGTDTVAARTPTVVRIVQLERVEVVRKRLAPNATLAQSARFEAPAPRAQ
jgi:hypothetical protein